MFPSDGFEKLDRGNDAGRGGDLRSLAVLDAMGMLDEVDASEFDRAFRDASPSVQAELRDLQASVAADPAFLASNEEPPADLKVRTLARVMTDVERQDARFAPIALIGRTARARQNLAPAADAREHALEVSVLRKDVERFSRSSYAWRAAAIALAAALTVALVFQLSVRSFASTIAAYALGSASTQSMLEALGKPGADRRIESAAVSRGICGTRGSATVAVDADGTCTLLASSLRPGEDYRLRLVDDLGAVTYLHSFKALRTCWVAEFGLGGVPQQAFARGRIELVDSSGAVVMRS